MKNLKLYSWELMFKSMIDKIRHAELVILKKMAYFSTLHEFIMNINPFLVSAISFGTFILLNDNEQLNAEKTFVTIALFNALRHPLHHLPCTLSNCVQV
jgi:ATP-binding cassette subfamily C (CFTR/MRP) protein 1